MFEQWYQRLNLYHRSDPRPAERCFHLSCTPVVYGSLGVGTTDNQREEMPAFFIAVSVIQATRYVGRQPDIIWRVSVIPKQTDLLEKKCDFFTKTQTSLYQLDMMRYFIRTKIKSLTNIICILS